MATEKPSGGSPFKGRKLKAAGGRDTAGRYVKAGKGKTAGPSRMKKGAHDIVKMPRPVGGPRPGPIGPGEPPPGRKPGPKQPPPGRTPGGPGRRPPPKPQPGRPPRPVPVPPQGGGSAGNPKSTTSIDRGQLPGRGVMQRNPGVGSIVRVAPKAPGYKPPYR